MLVHEMAGAAVDRVSGEGTGQRTIGGHRGVHDGIAGGESGIRVAAGVREEILREAGFKKEPLANGHRRGILARIEKAGDDGTRNLEAARRLSGVGCKNAGHREDEEQEHDRASNEARQF